MAQTPWKKLALATLLGALTPMPAFAQQHQPTQSQLYSDTELQAFAKARAEIEPLQLAEFAASTAGEHARAENQIDAALARNGMSREEYDSIATVAQADPSLSARIAQFAHVGRVPHSA
jgi:hypothetical protein